MNGLSKLVKEERLNNALTQEEFAKKVRLTTVTISRIENGAKAGSKILKNLSNYFNMSTRELRRLNNENNEQE